MRQEREMDVGQVLQVMSRLENIHCAIFLVVELLYLSLQMILKLMYMLYIQCSLFCKQHEKYEMIFFILVLFIQGRNTFST